MNRGTIALAAALLLAACSDGDTIDSGLAPRPTVDGGLNEIRQEVIDEIEDLAATDIRVDILDEVAGTDGRSLIRMSVTVTGDADTAEQYVFELADYMSDAWDGVPPSKADFEMHVASTLDGPHSVWRCPGEVMDRVKAREITQDDWRAECS
jgi:hypothetical protein